MGLKWISCKIKRFEKIASDSIFQIALFFVNKDFIFCGSTINELKLHYILNSYFGRIDSEPKVKIKFLAARPQIYLLYVYQPNTEFKTYSVH